MPAPQKVFLHIGLHKTGTTYLQQVLRSNRDALQAQGVEYPAGPGIPIVGFAVLDLEGRRPRGVDDRRIAGQWDALVAHVNGCGQPAVIVSEERLSLATAKQVRAAVGGFADSEMHVIVTVRDLSRVIVSAWQEEIKNDNTWTWRRFADAVNDPAQLAANPARGFWLRQDVAKICRTWETAVPAARMHIVTVPTAGSPRTVLRDRFSAVIGVDAAQFSEPADSGNQMVGVPGTEVIRRLNERLGGRLNQRAYDKVVKSTLVQGLAVRAEPTPIQLSDDEAGWIAQRADDMIAAIGARGYSVVGDLDDLRPRPPAAGRRPDDATDVELLEATLDALTVVTEEYATSWWKRKRAAVETGEGGGGGAASRTRRAIYKGKSAAATVVDKNPVAAKAVGAVLRARDRTRRE
jgi:hypothetical protein